ncbi:MAG: hypothetical protein KKA19_02325, partial [Candidatus Margulisbacteria bacterium]|nr:hypothetical protein [Candidatus Margulisiibacteriota bacterium]
MGEQEAISAAYISYLREVLARQDVNPAAKTAAYLEFVEHNGFLPAGVEAIDLSSWNNQNNNTLEYLKKLEADGNYVINEGELIALKGIDTTTDSFFINSLEVAPNTTIDAAFGYSDLTGTYHQASSYIDPYDPYVLQLLNLLKEKGLLNGKTSADNRAKAVYNYVIKYFDYIADYKGDDWNFAGETIQAQGGDCEDLSILLTSLGIAALMDGGLSYEEANRRFTAVAGTSTIYGDHVVVKYADDTGQAWIMDPSLATQGELQNINQLQTAESWNKTFTTYFTFNDNQVNVEIKNSFKLDALSSEVTAGRSYVDYLDPAVQSFVAELIKQNILSKQYSTDQNMVNLYNFISFNYKYIDKPRADWNFADTTLNINMGNAADLAVLYINAALAAIKQFDGANISKRLKLSYGELAGENYAYVQYIDEQGLARIIDIGQHMSVPKNILGFTAGPDNPLELIRELEFTKPFHSPFFIEDFALVSSLNGVYKEAGVFNIQDQCWQKRVIKSFNPRFGLGLFLEMGGKVDDRSGSIEIQNYDPLKFDEKPNIDLDEDLAHLRYENLYRGDNTKIIEQTSNYAGDKLKSALQIQIQQIYNAGKFYDRTNEAGFWAFKEDLFESYRENIRRIMGINNALIMVGQAKATGHGLVVQEISGLDGYKQMNLQSIAQSEMSYVMRAASDAKREMISNVQARNDAWKQALDKWISAKKNWMSRYPDAVISGLISSLGLILTEAAIYSAIIVPQILAATAAGMNVPVAIGWAFALGGFMGVSLAGAISIGALTASGVISLHQLQKDQYEAAKAKDAAMQVLKWSGEAFLIGMGVAALTTAGYMATAAIKGTIAGIYPTESAFGAFGAFMGLFFSYFALGQNVLNIDVLGKKMEDQEKMIEAEAGQKLYAAQAIEKTYSKHNSNISTANPITGERKLQKYLYGPGHNHRQSYDVISNMEEDMWSYMANTATLADDYSTNNFP